MAKKKAKKKEKGLLGTVLAVTTALNLVLSLLLAVLHRLEVIHAVRGEEEIQVLLTARKTTETPEN